MNELELLSTEEFLEKHKELTGHRLLMRNLHDIKHCSAGMFGECVVGTLLVPDKGNYAQHRLRCGFYMDEDRLIIIDDEKNAEKIFREMAKEESFEGGSPALIMFELIEYLVRDDLPALEEYEKKLDEIEDMITDKISDVPDDFDGFVSEHRKELRRLSGYYELLADVTEVMAEAMTKAQHEKERQLFSFLSSKVDRLYRDTLGMSEYVLQIRDIYQSRISYGQNRVMHLLTIVTAIFMPLTLIAGWYGMNFRQMPELSFRYGYLFTAVLAVVIVVVEIIIFKRKKWF